MKKILVLTFVLYASIAFSQTETTDVLVNKKGVAILPVAGDWGIGISASPFLEYAGNLLTNAYNPAPIFSSAKPGYIYGKYYLSDNTALRAGLRIGMTSQTEKFMNAFDNNEFDKYKYSALNLGISAGIEKYKNFGSRLRGYYGGDVIITKTPNFSGKLSYTDALDKTLDYVEKGGNTYTLGVQGIIGLEYFFAPNMSVSSEFGIMLYGSTTGDRKTIFEDGSDDVISDLGGSGYGISTNTTSLINLFFYF